MGLGEPMNRKEAIALLSELGTNQLVNPNFVLIEERRPHVYQLKIKGDYCLQEIKLFLKNMFSITENNNYLIIYTA
jgi:hypothetical protein